MIGGIFETIGKTLGVGKEQYFLELDETAEMNGKAVQTPAPKPVKAAEPAASDVADKVQPVAVEAATQKAPAKKDTGKKAVTSTEKVSAPKAKQPAASKVLSPEELIVNAIAANGKAIDSAGNVVEEAQTFATDFLMPASRSRRRPGPGLGEFKDMAKSVNSRLRG